MTADPHPAAVIYYSDNRHPEPLASACWHRLRRQCEDAGLRLVYVGHRPAPVGWTSPDIIEVVAHEPRPCQGQIYRNIRIGLDSLAFVWPRPDYVYLAEHDCLYDPARFDGRACWPGRIVYDRAAVRLTRRGWVNDRRPLLSACCAPFDLLTAAVAERDEHCRGGARYKWGELGNGDSFEGAVSEIGVLDEPARVVDIRWGGNYTGGDRAGQLLDTLPGWGDWRDVWATLGGLDAYTTGK